MRDVSGLTTRDLAHIVVEVPSTSRDGALMAVISEKHRQVWNAIHAFVRNHGGIVVSQPHASPIRFQCSPGSELPKLLENMRFDLHHIGGAERIGPVTEMVQQHGRPDTEAVARDQTALATFDVYEFPMPPVR